LNGQNVTLQAGNYISLEPGFIADENSNFQAYIAECSTDSKNIFPTIINNNTTNYTSEVHFPLDSNNIGGIVPTDNFINNENIPEVNDSVETFLISPNPTNDYVKIQIGFYLKNTITLSLVDDVGEELLTICNNAIITNKEFKVDLSKFAAGVYYIKLITNDMSDLKKIILLKK